MIRLLTMYMLAPRKRREMMNLAKRKNHKKPERSIPIKNRRPRIKRDRELWQNNRLKLTSSLKLKLKQKLQ